MSYRPLTRAWVGAGSAAAVQQGGHTAGQEAADLGAHGGVPHAGLLLQEQPHPRGLRGAAGGHAGGRGPRPVHPQQAETLCRHCSGTLKTLLTARRQNKWHSVLTFPVLKVRYAITFKRRPA
jgi:hypothetical protein